MERTSWLWSGPVGYSADQLVMVRTSWLWCGPVGYGADQLVIVRTSWLWSGPVGICLVKSIIMVRPPFNNRNFSG